MIRDRVSVEARPASVAEQAVPISRTVHALLGAFREEWQSNFGRRIGDAHRDRVQSGLDLVRMIGGANEECTQSVEYERELATAHGLVGHLQAAVQRVPLMFDQLDAHRNRNVTLEFALVPGPLESDELYAILHETGQQHVRIALVVAFVAGHIATQNAVGELELQFVAVGVQLLAGVLARRLPVVEVLVEQIVVGERKIVLLV